jgi:hypothetical protein
VRLGAPFRLRDTALRELPERAPIEQVLAYLNALDPLERGQPAPPGAKENAAELDSQARQILRPCGGCSNPAPIRTACAVGYSLSPFGLTASSSTSMSRTPPFHGGCSILIER